MCIFALHTVQKKKKKNIHIPVTYKNMFEIHSCNICSMLYTMFDCKSKKALFFVYAHFIESVGRPIGSKNMASAGRIESSCPIFFGRSICIINWASAIVCAYLIDQYTHALCVRGGASGLENYYFIHSRASIR